MRIDPIDVCAERLPYCLELDPLPQKCLDLHEVDPEMKAHDYQDILERPSTFGVQQQCAKLVSKLRQRLSCRRDVYDNLSVRHPSAMDSCRCYPPCRDVTYDTSYSLSTLPPVTREHVTFYSHLYMFLQNMSPERQRLFGVKHHDKITVLDFPSLMYIHRTLYMYNNDECGERQHA